MLTMCSALYFFGSGGVWKSSTQAVNLNKGGENTLEGRCDSETPEGGVFKSHMPVAPVHAVMRFNWIIFKLTK